MDVNELRRRLAGEVVAREDFDYEQRRRHAVWNRLTPPGRPAALVRVVNERDVVQAIGFARENGLRVAIRGGGHHWSGTPLRDGALLLDLSLLDSVEVDPGTLTARARPAATNRELARRLAAHDLAFPLGHCATIALSGYLLSGGLGWNPGVWGPGCANVEAVEVVTADGREIVADAAREPDLFWAARGAGPGFPAVATRFHLKLHPLPYHIQSAALVYPLARLAEIGTWMEAMAGALSPSVELVAFIALAPPEIAAQCAADNGMACKIIATAFADSERAAAEALAPIESGVLPSGWLLRTPRQATPFESLFDNVGVLFPADVRCLADTFACKASASEVLSMLGAALAKAPSRESLALATVASQATNVAALSLPAGPFVVCYAIWREEGEDAANRAWHQSLSASLEPHAAGHYVGEANLSAPAERSFSPPIWQRLQAVRRRYDPDRLFCGFPGED